MNTAEVRRTPRKLFFVLVTLQLIGALLEAHFIHAGSKFLMSRLIEVISYENVPKLRLLFQVYIGDRFWMAFLVLASTSLLPIIPFFSNAKKLGDSLILKLIYFQLNMVLRLVIVFILIDPFIQLVNH